MPKNRVKQTKVQKNNRRRLVPVGLFILIFALIGVWLLITPKAATMASYYVSPNGSDSNPGTEAQPFATVQKARDIVRTRTSGMNGDIIVYLRDGRHVLNNTLVLNASDSGTNGFQIIWRSYPGERAVISAEQKFSGWSLIDQAKNMYRANVGTGLNTRQLYVNGVKAQRARSTKNPANFNVASGGFSTSFNMSGWRNLNEVELVGSNAWRQFYCRISSISSSNVLLQEPCWTKSQNTVPGWSFNHVDYVENAYELMDQQGEWYYDKPAGYLYYIPRGGENLNTAEVIAPRLDKLIDGQGTSNSPIHHITFSDLSFAYAGWTFPNSANGYVVIQTGYYIDPSGDKLIPGNVHFAGTRNVTFENNVFAHLGGAGLNFERGSQNITIRQNKFEDISSHAISLGNVFDNGETNTNNQNRFFTVTNNYITKTGVEYYDSGGIMGGYLDSANITHNEIFDISHSPVALGWGWGANSYAKNNTVSYNKLHKYTQVLNDSAGVYTLSPQPGTQIHHNYMDNAVGWFGCLYPDEGSAFMNWHHNVCSRVRQWLHLWTGSIHDNQVQFNYSDTTVMENNGTNNTVNNNTFITNGNWPAEAQTIMAEAGIEPAFASVKNLPLPPPPSSQTAFIPEDINQDGAVNILDFSLLSSKFGQTTSLGRSDINQDGIVNILDFSLLAAKFGT